MNTFKKSMIAILTIATVSGANISTAQAGKWWKKPLVTGIGVGVGLGVTSAIINHNRPRYVERNCWNERVTYRNSYGEYFTKIERVCD